MGGTAVGKKHSALVAGSRARAAPAYARFFPLEQSTSESHQGSSAPAYWIAACLGCAAAVAAADQPIFLSLGTVGGSQAGKDCDPAVTGHRPATGRTRCGCMLSRATRMEA